MRDVPKIMCIVLAFLIPYSSHTQQEVKASLKELARIDSINALAAEFFQQSNYSACQELLQSTVAEARKTGYKKGEGAACIILGNVAYATRNFVAAEQYGKLAIDIFKQDTTHTMLAEAWVVWARAVWAQSRFNEAINAFEKARQLFDQFKDSARSGDTYSLLAMAEEERGNYERSFQYSTKALQYKNQGAFIAIGQLYADVGDNGAALEYYAKVTDTHLKILNYLKVGEAYFLSKRYDSALYFYQRYLSNIKYEKDVSKPYTLLGELYFAEKKYDSALYYLQNALAGFKEVNDRNWVMRSLLELSKVYKETGNSKAALEYSRELLTNAEQTGARQYARDAHYLLYELFDRLHNTDSAYGHLIMYTTLNNAIDIDMSARRLAFFQASAELEQAELKIDLLNRQKQLQQEEIKQAARQKMLLFAGIIVLLVLFIILARNFFLKKKNAEHLRVLVENELEIEKLQHTKQLSELEMQVLRAQMNPHFIFNSLNSISRFVLHNNKAAADEYLTKFSRLVRMILQNSQNSLISLENELDSLKLYLDLEAIRFENQFTYTITIGENTDASMLRVPPLIVQPFVENAVWHGLMPKQGIGHVKIYVTTQQNCLLIKIIDDGVGRAESALRQHSQTATHRSLGINITSQRIKMMHSDDADIIPVNVTDLVDSFGKAAGTEVTLKLPLCYD